MGMSGVKAFLKNHVCNSICKGLCLKSVGRMKQDDLGTQMQLWSVVVPLSL
jgi:hypothetical protein